MKAKELRDLSNTELTTRSRELRDQLFHLRLQKAGGQIENSSLFRSLRKDVARIETILSSRKLEEAAAAKK
jgi:large subunit ribosomal protein L29